MTILLYSYNIIIITLILALLVTSVISIYKPEKTLSSQGDILATLLAARELDDDQLAELATTLSLPERINDNLYQHKCQGVDCKERETLYIVSASPFRGGYYVTGTYYLCDLHFRAWDKKEYIAAWESKDGRKG